jgi:hypothetical protein
MSAAQHILSALSRGLARVPQNRFAWTYTIRGFDGSDYLTRTLLPRIGDRRVMVHHIHRADTDRWLHNHPWREASFHIMCGGYVEERLVDGDIQSRAYTPGDTNHLDAGTFHRITSVLPNTWTVGLIGPRVQDWGFLVDDALVPWRDYFAQQNHEQNKVPS